jgi:hypothetical protein
MGVESNKGRQTHAVLRAACRGAADSSKSLEAQSWFACFSSDFAKGILAFHCRI